MSRLRVRLDGTPLLGSMTGVGTYTARLTEALAARGDLDVGLTPFTVRSATPPSLPAGVSWRHRPAPARLLRGAWTRSDLPPVEWLAGACEVFHGTNFVLPPLRRAAGVLTVHDLAYLRHAETVDATSLAYQVLVPRGLRRAALVLTPSATVAGEVADQYGLPDDRVRATPLGVDPAWSVARPVDAAGRAELGLPADYLLFVGTLEPRKNLRTLLAAHAAARNEGALELVVVGGDGWGERLDTSGVVRTGYLPVEQLRPVVAGAAAVCLPSRAEGFGIPVLEALACGVPVLASDLPVLREVAGDQATYLPVDDVDAWAGALLAPPRRSAELDAARRARAAAFTWTRTAELTAQAYRDAAS